MRTLTYDSPDWPQSLTAFPVVFLLLISDAICPLPLLLVSLVRLLPLQNIAFAAQPDAKQVHVLSSGLKAAATWTRVEVLQNCRWGWCRKAVSNLAVQRRCFFFLLVA